MTCAACGKEGGGACPECGPHATPAHASNEKKVLRDLDALGACHALGSVLPERQEAVERGQAYLRTEVLCWDSDHYVMDPKRIVCLGILLPEADER